MISAREALALPNAQVSSSDAEAAVAILREVEDFVRANMRRNGCTFPIDASRLNAVIAAEVQRACRRAGYIAEFKKSMGPSTINPKVQVVIGFDLALAPTEDAYDQHDGWSAK